MANTVDQFPTASNPVLTITNVPLDAGDDAFTFQKTTCRALIQSNENVTSMFFAAASAGHAGFLLPQGGAADPMELRIPDIAGQSVIFKGTNGKTVQIIEYAHF